MGNSAVNGDDAVAVNDTSDVADGFQVYRFRYERQILATMLTLVSFCGIIGNTAVIAAIPVSRKLRTVTNVFVVNLSVSDLLACAFIPWNAVAVLTGEEGWPLPDADWLCSATGAILTLCITCSVVNLAVIAINRYIGITKSRADARRVFNPRNIAGMVLFTWALPFIVTFILPLLGVGEFGYEPLYNTCSWVKSNPFSLLVNITTGVVYIVCLIVIALCYALIFRYVLKSSRRMARRDAQTVSGAVAGGSSSSCTTRKKLWRRQIVVTKNLVYIVLAYVVCLTPFAFSSIPLGFDWSIRMTPYAATFLYVNSCINPIIYGTSHPDFKEAFGFMLRCRRR